MNASCIDRQLKEMCEKNYTSLPVIVLRLEVIISERLYMVRRGANKDTM